MSTARTSTVELRVRYAETDQMGVVYHTNYLIWCEIGRTDHLRGLGTTYREIEAGGVSLAVTEASIRFHAPARYDDRIRVATWISAVASRTVTFDYHITNADTDARLATARTVLVSLGRDGRVVAMPRELRERLSHDAGRAA